MCSGPGQSKSTSSSSPSAEENKSNSKDMGQATADMNDAFSNLLELAANNDYDGMKQLMDCDASVIDEVGLWYSRKKCSKQIVLEHRTPLMVAATYGSVDVIKLILSIPGADANFSCGQDKTTALHCAASGGSINVLEVVKLLLSAGADPNLVDANGLRAVDVIVVPPKLPGFRASLEMLLMNNGSDGSVDSVGNFNLRVSVAASDSISSTLSSSPGNRSPCSPSDSVSSPMEAKLNDLPLNLTMEKKEYPIDPSLPDIKNSIYSTDEFRMFSFKVRPCSRAYSHDWTECPFVHPGENARRRDPRKYHYSCVPCPDFRKGACRRGDMCEYAHGVFECWLHPAQYRTRLCKDGTGCERRVCFFAHTPEELRPLYVSTGSAVPSPRSNSASASTMDMAAALSLLPGSPSMMPTSPFHQPMSPSGNGMSQSSMAWPQPNVPTLNLPGSNLQSSRLRSSYSARDILPNDLSMLSDFDAQQQLLNDLTGLSQMRSNSNSLNRSCLSKTLTPSNLEELFSAEMGSSPRYADQSAASGVFSPSHKAAVLSQFQQQQSMLSPINTNVFSPKNGDHSLLQTSFGVSSPRGMSPRSMEPISPMSARLSAFAQREKQHQQLRSLSSRELGSNLNSSIAGGSPVGSPWSKLGSSNAKVDWSVNGSEMGQLGRSASLGPDNHGHGPEPDLSWVHTLVKESPPDIKNKVSVPVSGMVSSGEATVPNSQVETVDHSVLGAWLEQMQLDQLVA